MAVAEVELLDAVVNLLLTDDWRGLAVWRVQAPVHKRRRIVVEAKGAIKILALDTVLQKKRDMLTTEIIGLRGDYMSWKNA